MKQEIHISILPFLIYCEELYEKENLHGLVFASMITLIYLWFYV